MQLRLAAALLLIGVVGTAAIPTTGDTITGSLLDTSSLSFYGFYGFYGVTPGPTIECDIVTVQFNLYNYGAQDLTSVATIKLLIEKTKLAIDMTYLEAVPTGSTDDYVTTVTELDGSAVTFITVTVEVNFIEGKLSPSEGRTIGGVFGSYIGLTESDMSSAIEGEDYFIAPPAPETGVCSLGLDTIVKGYDVKLLEASDNEMVAFQTTVQSSMQSAILESTKNDAAAAGASTEILGITAAGDEAVAVRLYVHFSCCENTCKDWQSMIEADPYGMANKFGPLEDRVKIVEITEVTDDIHLATDSDAGMQRKLLQNAVTGTPGAEARPPRNHLSRNLALAGLGVNSLDEGSITCRVDEIDTDFYGVYGVGTSAMGSAGVATSVGTDLATDVATELGTSVATDVATEIDTALMTSDVATDVVTSAVDTALATSFATEVGSSSTNGSSDGVIDPLGSGSSGSSGVASSVVTDIATDVTTDIATDVATSVTTEVMTEVLTNGGGQGQGSDSTGQGSSDGAMGTSRGPATSVSSNVGPDVSTAVVDGVSNSGFVSAGGSSSDYAFYGMYGSSSFYGMYGSSFYGMYGAAGAGEVTSGQGTSSSGTMDTSRGTSVALSSGAQSSGASFYGYQPSTPSRPSSPSSSPSSSKPGPSPGPGPSPIPSPPDVKTYPVFFTTILSDYDMADLTGEDMEQFKTDYIAAVDSAIKLLGITSNPTVEVLDVRSASIAVDTLVTFFDDAQGAELLMKVLSENPSLAFPAFSSLGPVTIRDVSSAPSDEAGRQSANAASECSQIDRNADCCVAPFALDAKLDCCWSGVVDECGVCGGDGSSCALSAVVRVSTPNKPGLMDKDSAAFQSLVKDFKEGMAILFSSYKVDAVTSIEVDESSINIADAGNGDLFLDVPFVLYPDASNGIQVPSIPKAKSILMNAVDAKMTHEDLTLEAVLSVGRKGVCNNGICEAGEMMSPDGKSSADLCAADCPGVVSCPVGSSNDIVGSKYQSCTGSGVCVLATGECRCKTGYAGANCGQCAPGYTAMNGECNVQSSVTTPSSDPSAQTQSAQDVKSTEEGSGSSTKTRDIVLGVVFGVVALILVALLMYWLLVLRKRRAESREEGLAFSSQQQVPASNEEPDIPTRQAAENTV